ncbi:hypothetical protein [Pantoea sp. 18069]|uniref:hypothetical protein n=1 Tax=Pantoea sp. 18069 TaxID=2681415 RepID=UPI00135C72E8|nr:hypothetical protein [Pantoea sp. 18069]
MRRRKPRQQASSGSARGPIFKSIPVSQLTDKDRKDWVVAIGEQARSELADALSEVETLIARVEPFQTLAVMASYALMRFVTKDNSRKRATPEVQQGHVEFLQAMYLRLGPSTLLSPSTPDDIQVLFDQLPRLFSAQHQARLPTRESVDRPVTADDGALQIVQEYLRAHTTVVRNWGYFSSVTRISGELLSGIDQQFRARCGLAASDVVKLFEHLVRRQEKRVSDHWSRVQDVLCLVTVDEMVDAFFARFPFDGETAEAATELKREALTTRRLKAALLPMADQYLAAEFFFGSDQITQETGLPPAAVESLLRKLSLSFGALTNTPVDRLFLNNPVWLRPLIALDSPGQYFCALPQTLMSFVYPIVDELVKPHPEVAKRLSDVRAHFLESEVERLLKVAFPDVQVVPGFKWRDGDQEFETDAMLRFDSTILLVESKSAKVSWPALRGAPDRLLRDVRELIVTPSEQSGRLAAKLQQEIALRSAGSAPQMDFPLSLDKVTAVVRLSVSLQDFATVQSVPSLLAQAGVLNNLYPLAPCISLADLEVLIDLFEQPHVRLHYIRQRASTMLAHQVVGDELDMLGLYLDTSLNFGGLQPGEQNITLNGYSARLDRYYTARDEGEHARKPRRATIAWFNRLCEQISKRPMFGWSELTGALLSLTPIQQQKVEREVQKIARRIREGKPVRDSKDTIVLVGPEWANTALAIRARDKRQPGKFLEGAEHLASEVFEHKHVERCCMVAVDALDQQLPYLGGALLTRADRPVPATIFF